MDQARPSVPDHRYLEQRQLRRHARVPQLWALGVGAVISGDFFGWNFGLREGGFAGMMVAMLVMTAAFAGLCFSIAEMSAALPHTGGAYSFSRAAMGPWGGFLTGLAENIEHVLTPAVIVVGLGGYLAAVFRTSPAWAPLWWLLCYGVFLIFNIAGAHISFRLSVVVTLCALAVLFVFFIRAVPLFAVRYWLMNDGNWFRGGWQGTARALPFALWVYLGIEQLPLAAEESFDPVRDMPRGMLTAFATLVLFAFGTVMLNAGIPPGAAAVGVSGEPLFLGFRTVFGDDATARWMALVGCVGLAASFHAILFAFGRQIYSLSRAGYFPTTLSVTHASRQTPARALVVGSILGFMAALTILFTGQNSRIGATLLNMAVFGAVLAYVFQMASFVLLRWRFPQLARPYRSPLGVAGAIVAGLISLATLCVLLANPEYRMGIVGTGVWMLAGIFYFVLRGRHQLVLAPEEAFAEELNRKRACQLTVTP